MSTQSTASPSPAAPAGGPPPRGAKVARTTWHGVRTVAALEMRQRSRQSRWLWVFGIWLLVIYGIVGLTWMATRSLDATSQSAILYGVTVVVVLGLALLVAPSLSASAISGDREHGVLATLQTTLLSPMEIALGKLLASWAAAAAFFVLALPVLLFAMIRGGVSPGRITMALLTIALSLAVVCAMGLMFSALSARTVTAVVLTYLALGALVFGSVILFGLTTPLTTTTERVTVRVEDPSFQPSDENGTWTYRCIDRVEDRDVTHTERTWWILTVNPFVVVADAGSGDVATTQLGADPLLGLSQSVRGARLGDSQPVIECWSEDERTSEERATLLAQQSPVWPYGAAALAALGIGSFAVVVRRLRTPAQTLPRGTRIA